MNYLLFYAPGTASLAVHWMLIELGVDFETHRLDLEAGEQRSRDFLRLNPAGRVPTLVIDRIAYTESAALLMMLAERYPEAHFAPPIGAESRGKWLEMMVYLANTLSSAMRDWFYADRDGNPADAESIRRLALRRIENSWERLNSMLADRRPYLLGDDLTTVDFLATMFMRWARNMPRPATTWPQIASYCVRIRAREGFREVCRREGLVDWLNT